VYPQRQLTYKNNEFFQSFQRQSPLVLLCAKLHIQSAERPAAFIFRDRSFSHKLLTRNVGGSVQICRVLSVDRYHSHIVHFGEDDIQRFLN